MADREFDIVLFGASGFVGRLVAQQLARHAPDGMRIALAGRTRSRVEDVRDGIGMPWPALTADSGDEAALHGLATSTGVIWSRVRPARRRR